MNWTRRHIDNEDSKHRKEWRAGRGRYRLVWRDQAFGVTVLPGYQCCIRVLVSGRSMWDFINRKRPLYRTFKSAKDACEKHADPSYRPARKKKKKKVKAQQQPKRKAPMRPCPKCGVRNHVRKAICNCGYRFPKKVKE